MYGTLLTVDMTSFFYQLFLIGIVSVVVCAGLIFVVWGITTRGTKNRTWKIVGWSTISVLSLVALVGLCLAAYAGSVLFG